MKNDLFQRSHIFLFFLVFGIFVFVVVSFWLQTRRRNFYSPKKKNEEEEEEEEEGEEESVVSKP
jgi:hypothetical protein